MAPEVDGDFVVFLIGMRVNRPWKVHKWLPVFMAMPRMLRELSERPEMGLMGYRLMLANPFAPLVIQYWRSFEQLEAFSRGKENTHFPAWMKFNKRVGSGGDVGIWHETYRVRAGEYEGVYNNMPPTGLGKAGRLIPASGRHATAPGRMGLTDGSDGPAAGEGSVSAAEAGQTPHPTT
ncbi:MAG: DUF4188 domain-containing protein [Dehalococcoidia bacterium]